MVETVICRLAHVDHVSLKTSLHNFEQLISEVGEFHMSIRVESHAEWSTGPEIIAKITDSEQLVLKNVLVQSVVKICENITCVVKHCTSTHRI